MSRCWKISNEIVMCQVENEIGKITKANFEHFQLIIEKELENMILQFSLKTLTRS